MDAFRVATESSRAGLSQMNAYTSVASLAITGFLEITLHQVTDIVIKADKGLKS